MYLWKNFKAMKKRQFVFFLLCISTGFSQNKFKPGVYVSQNDQKGIELKINEDDTYELILLSGKIEVENDTLKLKNKYSSSSLFEVTEVIDQVNSGTLKINFNQKHFDYYASKIFIGSQKDENDIVEYKNILEYITDDQRLNETDSKINFTINRGKYIHLIVKDRYKISSSKYKINENVSGLDVVFSSNNIASLQLKAYYKDENSIIVTEGKQPLLFTMVNKEDDFLDKELKPIEVDNDAKIVLPNNKENYESEEEVSFENAEEEKAYVFKHKVEPTLKEALATLNKTPNKFLVVEQNSTKEDFDAFIKENEAELTNTMYYEYEADYDLYNYYLANKKDERVFKSQSKQTQIIILNAEGEKLYYTNGSLADNKELLNNYSSIYAELVKANIYMELDRSFANKKNSIPEIKAIFSKIIEMETPYEYGVIAETDVEVSPPPPIIEVVEPVENAIGEASDEVDAVAEVAWNYYEIKDKQNLYQLKTPKKAIVSKWEQILDYYTRQVTFDKEIVKIIKKELVNTGFSVKLLGQNIEQVIALNYEGLDYLLKFYKQIKADEKLETEKDYEYETVDLAISSFLNKIANTYNEYPNEDKLKAINYYKKYVESSNNSINVLGDYTTLLGLNLDILKSKSDYYNAYETYFNILVSSDNGNIIETLDNTFTNSEFSDWSNFKYSFSNLANDVSWSVVQNEKDIQLIKKAITWSETGLKVTKNNGYFLDTLAQLYFKDGQKEKAIATQKQALLAMKGDEESETYIEMKAVLQKMEKGTY